MTTREAPTATAERPRCAADSATASVASPARGLLGKAAHHARQRGVLGMSALAARRLHSRWLEWRLGIHTRGSIDASQLGATGVCFGYQPVDYHSFMTAMRHVDAGPDDVFADYGCGMGRAVVLAARHRLRRVFGVELSPELCEIARENLRRASPRLKTAAEIHCADATRFVTPDDLTLLMMFNPFSADVMQAAMERVRESLARRPRRLQIIYVLPKTDHDALAELPWLDDGRPVRTHNHDWERLTIYENTRHRGAQR